MRVQEIMTPEPACCTENDSARDAARLMHEHDCGLIPVVQSQDSRTVVGVVTDRDIAVRGVAQGRNSDTPVREVMTRDPECCAESDEVEQVERVMAQRQVRRVPIIDDAGQLVGIIAQADLALDSSGGVTDEEVGDVVERISEPGRRVKSASAD